MPSDEHDSPTPRGASTATNQDRPTNAGRVQSTGSTSQTEVLDRVVAYARTVPIDVDHDSISWEFSRRAKRRAGVCLYDDETGSVTIRLAWKAYRRLDWSEFTDVVRHELVHAWEYQEFGESGHGSRFTEQAEAVDASRYCPSFTDPRLELACLAADCDWRLGRHRASVTVTQPDERRCGACGSRYEVVHCETGTRWRTHRGYVEARDRIGTDW